MLRSAMEHLVTPRRDDLGLKRIANNTGLSISVLPNGAIFAIEHARENHRIIINQTLGSPIAGSMGRFYLRVGGTQPTIVPVIGPEAQGRLGVAEDRIIWQGDQHGVHHQVSLWLHGNSNVWRWRLDVTNKRDEDLLCDAVFIQDLGLGDQGFLMGNEAYASQYLDHHIARHSRLGYVLHESPKFVSGRGPSVGGAWLS